MDIPTIIHPPSTSTSATTATATPTTAAPNATTTYCSHCKQQRANSLFLPRRKACILCKPPKTVSDDELEDPGELANRLERICRDDHWHIEAFTDFEKLRVWVAQAEVSGKGFARKMVKTSRSARDLNADALKQAKDVREFVLLATGYLFKQKSVEHEHRDFQSLSRWTCCSDEDSRANANANRARPFKQMPRYPCRGKLVIAFLYPQPHQSTAVVSLKITHDVGHPKYDDGESAKVERPATPIWVDHQVDPSLSGSSGSGYTLQNGKRATTGELSSSTSQRPRNSSHPDPHAAQATPSWSNFLHSTNGGTGTTATGGSFPDDRTTTFNFLEGTLESLLAEVRRQRDLGAPADWAAGMVAVQSTLPTLDRRLQALRISKLTNALGSTGDSLGPIDQFFRP